VAGGDLSIVLDDDPTGTQAVRDVPVLLDRCDEAQLAAAAGKGRPAVHVMTNTRALPAREAEEVTEEATRAARRVLPHARLVLRGDSTLRGHLLPEYRAVRRAAFSDRPPVLLLVPALPAAGRITHDGVHWLVVDSRRHPLHQTEYAQDSDFAYRSARLLDWAAERSGGYFDPAAGRELFLERLRDGGPDAVAEMLLAAADGGAPAVCAPDAESLDDLVIIAAGLRAAEAAGAPVLARAAPAFAAVLAGTLADGLVPTPLADQRGVLVVCGSYVSGTTRQLADLRRRLGIAPLEVDARSLASGQPATEISRVASEAGRQLAERGVAVVATPRARSPGTTSLAAGTRIARGLAAVVAALDALPAVVVAKGGITSHVVARDGLGVVEAWAVGPVTPGVALWNVLARGLEVAYLTFPGNVGGEADLTDLVARVRGG